MSLVADLAEQGWDSFPRVSGDEPKLASVASSSQTFSPRERG